MGLQLYFHEFVCTEKSQFSQTSYQCGNNSVDYRVEDGFIVFSKHTYIPSIVFLRKIEGVEVSTEPIYTKMGSNSAFIYLTTGQMGDQILKLIMKLV